MNESRVKGPPTDADTVLQTTALHPKLVRYLDPGIRRLVVLLNSWGFATCDSGDGVSKPPVGRVLDVPHVFCEVVPHRLAQEANRMAMALAGVGIAVQPQGHGDACKFIAASYDPASRAAIIALIGVTDRDLPPEYVTCPLAVLLARLKEDPTTLGAAMDASHAAVREDATKGTDDE